MKFERTNTKISLLEDFYSHFNEDDRLKTRHGNVEFITNIKYILDYIHKDDKIIDIGAGTGAYSIYLHEQGYDIEAIDVVKHNVDVMRTKCPNLKVHMGNAVKMDNYSDNSFDVAILFGPIYHLLKEEDKIKALKETKRIVKNNGLIFISYYMNDYAVISYGFIKNNIMESIAEGRIDENYHIISKEDDLFSMVNLEDINHFNEIMGFERIKIIASDGASDYLRTALNKLSDEAYEEFIKYHLKNCERRDLLGASSHLLDIVRVKKV